MCETWVEIIQEPSWSCLKSYACPKDQAIAAPSNGREKWWNRRYLIWRHVQGLL